MSHATSDLEFFKCDMCHTYMHKEMYCDHRRACKGKDSVELTKKQAASVAAVLDSSNRKSLVAGGAITPSVAPVEKTEKLQMSATRAKLTEEYLEEKRREAAKRTTMSVDDAMAFLES
jgi:hypothetical protein